MWAAWETCCRLVQKPQVGMSQMYLSTVQVWGGWARVSTGGQQGPHVQGLDSS